MESLRKSCFDLYIVLLFIIFTVFMDGVNRCYCIKRSKRRHPYTPSKSIINCSEIEKILESKVGKRMLSRDSILQVQKLIDCILEYAILKSCLKEKDSDEIVVVQKKDIQDFRYQVVDLLKQGELCMVHSAPESLNLYLLNDDSSIHPLLHI
ncbi:hypothetical protein WA171_000862 [Blastocystis sp. BT1]